ncbi:type IV toxin-antitoxin system AbiEi family antitoxin [Actinoplanes subtropicus]|uniref:type IV toxin-antitoxin system AbiEi family antitoxin n=1 Tax=Actinoplanes subtropicus TaxID=543632 RepID=UPI001FDEBD0D|nr:type IV toxin-antitoxin system AbiEi family antitoxin [Actinoplanes subtropicus]
MLVVVNGLLDAARERLRELGVTFEVEHRDPDAGIDAIITLSRDSQRQRYAAEAKAPMTLSSVIRGKQEEFARSPDPQLIIGNRISRRSADAFRAAGIQFVDASGNAYITFGNVLIDVRGRTESTAISSGTHRPSDRPTRPTNIFSSRRSQVIFALLSWPDLSHATVREIAAAAGVSTGQAHDTFLRLQQAGFLTTDSRRLERIDELLDLWTAAYSTGLGPRLELARYHGDPSRPLSGVTPERRAYRSGESAMGIGVVRPATLTVYIDHPDPKFPVLNRWDAGWDREPNIFLRQKFWASPRADEEEFSANGQNAPWLLIYADLVATRDARLREVAQSWRARFARSDEV